LALSLPCPQHLGDKAAGSKKAREAWSRSCGQGRKVSAGWSPTPTENARLVLYHLICAPALLFVFYILRHSCDTLSWASLDLMIFPPPPPSQLGLQMSATSPVYLSKVLLTDGEKIIVPEINKDVGARKVTASGEPQRSL
jgi:hypothetical protein